LPTFAARQLPGKPEKRSRRTGIKERKGEGRGDGAAKRKGTLQCYDKRRRNLEKTTLLRDPDEGTAERL